MQAGHRTEPGFLKRRQRLFRKLSVMLPPEIYERLIRESTRRKIAGEPKREVSSMMRDAIELYFKAPRTER